MRPVTRSTGAPQPVAPDAWLDRHTAFLKHGRAALLACVLVPILFGLFSVYLGQDKNWDLQNYHWYNPYALFNDRLRMDISPGNWQGYFNPLIDVPYYFLNQHFSGPVVGFLMGLMQGLDFVLLLAIARLLLPAERGNWRICILLALAGVSGAGFLSELGNTMGDNLSALFILSSLCVVLRAWDALQAASPRVLPVLLLAGFLMGLGTGLKLTNATYAVALCVALLAAPRALPRGVAAAFATGCGVLAGVALAAGPWWWRMWTMFGNPLFPQFNSLFKSPFAQQVAVMDEMHLPHGLGEALAWPLVFARDMSRISELPLKPAVLVVLYLLAIGFACRWVFERARAQAPAAALTPRARFLLLFGLVGYLAWLKLFSIYRYLVPIELLAPLMIWLLIGRLAPARLAGPVAGLVLLATTCAVYPVTNWGHAGWAAQSFSMEPLPIAHPESAIVFTAHGDPPMGWVSTMLPRAVRVIQLGSGFPESPAYLARIQAVVASRPGPHYVMLGGASNGDEIDLRRVQGTADWFGMRTTPARCARLEQLVRFFHHQEQVTMTGADGAACTLELHSDGGPALAARDREMVAAAREKLAGYGLQLDPAGCTHHRAFIGTDPFPIQFCPVSAGGGGTPAR
jgi:hypothetical protein